jgi:hypothetical protein
VTRALALLAAGLAVASAGAASVAGAPGYVVRDVTAGDLAPRAAVGVAEAATAWCGSAAQADRVPNAVAGNPVHWVYLIPSDGPDDLGTLASVMQSDAEQIDAWWRREDPARAPRNDLAAFPCGMQLDVTTVRMARTSAQLSPLQGRFAAIADALEENGLRSSFTKYAVYYDGPTADTNVCGQGGSEGSGFGLAVVYFRSCVGVSTAAVAAHELLHTLGAVSRSAPNDCGGDSSGHTCDDRTDVMYPSIGGQALQEKFLDPGRNDYYGHAGGWTDTQDSAWLVRLDSQVPLAVTVSGPGSVSSDVPGLSCSASCTTTWNDGQRLALTATPSPGARLVRWSGSCTGSAACVLGVGAGAAVTAQFAQASFRLAVSVSGRGTVRSSRPGITCRPRCSATLPSFTRVRLTATPAKGWKLRRWTGACAGSRLTCTVPMSRATSARAVFVRR